MNEPTINITAASSDARGDFPGGDVRHHLSDARQPGTDQTAHRRSDRRTARRSSRGGPEALERKEQRR